jgi:phage terminase large subunit-like protein
MLDLIMLMSPEEVVIDGSGAQSILKAELEEAGYRHILLPTVKEIIVANAKFEQLLYGREVCHMGQPSLEQVATNVSKRAIGSNGGFGYKAQFDQMEIGLLDSCILAVWRCSEGKEKKRQIISY